MAKTVLGEITIDSGFKVGMFVEVEYFHPSSSGRILLNLMRDPENIPFHFSPHFDSKALILNTFEEGYWKNEERPTGYDFAYEIKTKVAIYASNDHFSIIINDKFFYKFKYRKLHGTTIRKIMFSWEGDSATSARLLSLRIGDTSAYPPA